MLQIQEFEKDIKKGFPKFLYFCYATEPFFLSEVTRLIRNEIPSLEIETLDVSDIEEVDLRVLLNKNSLFGDKRVLILNNFEKIKKTETRVETLQKIMKHKSLLLTIVILVNLSTKELYEEITYLKNNEDCTIYNLDIYEKNLHTWISYKAKKYGITLKSDAIYYLIELTGGQPGLISSEIEKISLLTEKSTVNLSDIKDMLSEFGEFTAFDLIEALKRKDKKKVFRLIEKLQNTEPEIILGALNWYYSSRKENNKIYSILYKANLALRLGRSCSIELLLYELLKE